MSYDTPAPETETAAPVETEEENTPPKDPEAVVAEGDLDPEVPAHHGDAAVGDLPVEAQP